MFRPCTRTKTRSRCQAELFNSYLLLQKQRGSASLRGGSELLTWPSPSPSSHRWDETPCPRRPLSQARWSDEFKLYVPPKSGGTICHTPLTSTLSSPPLPLISVVAVEPPCSARPVHVIFAQQDGSRRPNPGAPQSLSQHEHSFWTSRACSSPGSRLGSLGN